MSILEVFLQKLLALLQGWIDELAAEFECVKTLLAATLLE